MIPVRPKASRARHSFTLVELLVVVAIIALMLGLVTPAFRVAMLKAQSTKCAGNLRTIGTAASLCATDNNGQYPEINQAAVPIYTNSTATNLVGAFGTYGVSTVNTQCPVDMGLNPSAFSTYGSSYEWNPVFDDENTVQPILYVNGNTLIPVNSSRVRLCMDFNSIHNNRANAVYGDGHVKAR